MATAAPIAKVSVGKSGYGVAHASYITQMSALDPEGKEGVGLREQEHDQSSLFTNDVVKTEPTARETIEQNLHEEALDNAGANQNRSLAGPVWTWNAPHFLTGDGCGIRPEFESRRAAQT